MLFLNATVSHFQYDFPYLKTSFWILYKKNNTIMIIINEYQEMAADKYVIKTGNP